MSTEFYVGKSTGTHADPMAAVGLAHLLEPVEDCTILDEGHRFTVRSQVDPANEIERLGQDPGYAFLRPNEKTAFPTDIPAEKVFDYPALKAAADRYREASKKAKKGASSGQLEAIEADAPPSDFYLYQTLNTLQGDDATNKFFRWIRGVEPEEWKRILTEALLAMREGRVPAIDLEASLVQLFDPHAAKGYARLKPDSTGRGDKTKDAWGASFLEWLRFRGYFQAACTYGVGPKREHVRVLYPIPRNISLRGLKTIAANVRSEVIFGSSVKIDCLAVLRLAQHLIRHDQQGLGGRKRRRPADYISGVSITHYQSLGSAKAVTSLEELAIPDWFDNATPDDERLWLETLQEHAERLRVLRDDISDELGLLQSYRRFLEHRGGRAMGKLVEFLESYGIYVLRQRGHNTWYHKQFQTGHLEAILAETSYSDILANPGFKAVAAALRSATVSAQSMKRNKSDHRDIRYDVLPELRRKRVLPGSQSFVETLTDFVATFNAESARRLEAGKKSGIRRVTTDELASLLGLVEQAKGGAATVGALLAAYATCREIRDPDDQADPAPAQDQSPGN